jgi:LCP family protein required for cell wall assembly
MLVFKRAVWFLSLGGLILLFLFGLGLTLATRLKSADGRINILLLGIPGGDHAGATLTDSMVLINIYPPKEDVAIISVPRDIWIPSLLGKINSAYAYGEAREEGGGLVLSKAIVEEILDLPVHYGVVVDFEGFKQAIDLIGGLDVFVENSFDDFRYPIAGREEDECGGDPEYNCRYEHLRFERGWEHMTGERALKFTRSRFATNSGEGTDFARSLRQKKVLLVFAKKVGSFKTLIQPRNILGFLKIFRESIRADITLSEALTFFRLIKKLDWTKARSFALDYGEDNGGGLLFSPPAADFGAWVLLPRGGNWDQVQAAIKEFLKLQG